MARVDAGTAGTQITNEAEVSWMDQTDPDVSDNKASATISVDAATIMKVVTGTYLGDGVAGRVVSGLKFRPDVIIIKADRNYFTSLVYSWVMK